MFKFLKDVVGAIKEGFDEAKQELEAEENAVQEDNYQLPQKDEISFSHIILALSNPFRIFFIDDETLAYLYEFGVLSKKRTEELKKYIKRDFDIVDQNSLNEAIYQWDEVFALLTECKECENIGEKKNLDIALFQSSTSLYMISSAVDLGYVDFKDYEDICKNYAKVISECELSSWKEFGDAFMRGDMINSALGKKILQKSVKRLLEDENSPWQQISWSEVARFAD